MRLFKPTIPPEFEQLIKKVLAKDPAERYQRRKRCRIKSNWISPEKFGIRLAGPPSSLDERVLVRSQGQSVIRGYLHLADLDRVQTGDHQFDLWHALALVRQSTDPADIKSRLENIKLETREADDIYLEFSENYARLAELSLPDRNAARAALEKANEYFNRIEGTLQSSERAQNLQKMFRPLEDKNPRGPDGDQQERRERRARLLTKSEVERVG